MTTQNTSTPTTISLKNRGTIIDDANKYTKVHSWHRPHAQETTLLGHHRGFTSGVSFFRRPGETYYKNDP